MLYNVLPVLLIFVSLAIIIVLVGRHLPEIASLNIDEIPEARSAAKKRQLLVERLDRRIRETTGTLWSLTSSVRTRAKDSSIKLYDKLIDLEARYRLNNSEPKPVPPSEVVAADLNQAEVSLATGHTAEAEKGYLEIIKNDNQNVEAYKGLGLLYTEIRQYDEARQSLEYARKLNPEDPATYEALAKLSREEGKNDSAKEAYLQAIRCAPNDISKLIGLGDTLLVMGDNKGALKAFREAVKLEPSNPRCLDRLLEVCILLGNKRLANNTLERLTEVNPENKKLQDFKDKINLISVKP